MVRLLIAGVLSALLLGAMPVSGEAFLHPVEKVPSGTILDHSPTKFLIEESGALRIRDRSTGAEELIPPVPNRPDVYGFLSPHGAIFVAGGESSLDVGIYEWRDGTLIDRGFPNSAGSLLVRGHFAIWNANSNLYREDLDTGAVTLVTSTAGNTENDLAANGDVAYWIGNQYEIVRFDGTSSDQLTNDPVLWNTYPLTDGINVAYRKHSQCCSNESGSIAVYTSTGEVVLDSFRNNWPAQRTDYDVAGGWVAYTHVGPGGELQTWRRAPDGTVTQVSPDGINTRIAAIAPSGDILFSRTSDGTLFSARLGSPPVDLGSRIGPGGERGGSFYFFQQSDRWFYVSGDTVYEVVTGYPRPKGATPARFPLVPAYEPCTTPNREHGPPLAFQSCSPPVKSSQHLTVGTADSNGQPPKFKGHVLLSTIFGNPATAADEADVALEVEIVDVRRSSDLQDYAGQLLLKASWQFVDRDTVGVGGGSTHGTTRAVNLTYPIACAPTADPTVGSTCSVTTTFDAGGGSFIKEGRRSIWQLGQMQVFDGGPDGDAQTDDNTLFAVQGIFVP